MSENDGVIEFGAWCAKADARREDDEPAANGVRRSLTTSDGLSAQAKVETGRQVRAGAPAPPSATTRAKAAGLKMPLPGAA